VRGVRGEVVKEAVRRSITNPPFHSPIAAEAAAGAGAAIPRQ